MSISIERKRNPRLRNVGEVIAFGFFVGVEEYDSKQFERQHGVRIGVMLTDKIARTYTNDKAGAELLLAHIKSEETDKSSWEPIHVPTDSIGGKLPARRGFVRLSLVKEDLDEAAFNRLPGIGMLDSDSIYFSQLRCSPEFQSAIELGTSTYKKVADLTAALKENSALANDFDPPIKIVFYRGKITTVDNRRLKAHREAHVQIRYQKKTWDELSGQEQGHFDIQAPAANISVT